MIHKHIVKFQIFSLDFRHIKVHSESTFPDRNLSKRQRQDTILMQGQSHGKQNKLKLRFFLNHLPKVHSDKHSKQSIFIKETIGVLLVVWLSKVCLLYGLVPFVQVEMVMK